MFGTFLFWEIVGLAVVGLFAGIMIYISKKQEDKKQREIYEKMLKDKERKERLHMMLNSSDPDAFKKYQEENENCVSSKPFE